MSAPVSEADRSGMRLALEQARLAREAASLASFRAGVGARISTMAQAQRWLFTEHGAYAPRSKPREPVDPALLKSY